MIPYAAGVIVPPALTLLVRNAKKEEKRGVIVDDVGGEPGHTVRNHQFKDPVSSHWEDISTLPELFEISCKIHSDRFFLGTRRLIAKEVETSEDGKVFEKLHLGDYEWKTFGQTLEAVYSFASGLVQIGHKSEKRVAIFADSREEWFIALQGCFRRNVTEVTIYSSLGEEALCHSLNEICSLCSWQPTNKK
ncbi:hypothetical protein Bca4012_027587 [Brassica carinata]|uniref:AMP-dependent synthetase/ligase domain-containing protein n=1 Tax=Brassica carinata TaxID=52824 RepID=A0A8X7VKK2_BRACI|nr:hypothetical protein Bca52824_024549 [Brassica carinata]